MIATGAQNTVVAAHLGVAESLVRALRSGDKPVTIDRVLAMPPSVALAVINAMRDALDEAPLSAMPCERHHLRITAAHGELASSLTEALADGVIDHGERRTLLPLAAKIEARAHALVVDLSRQFTK